MANNAAIVARTLADARINRAFGLPGGEVSAVIEACRRKAIEFFLVGHEASAAFMAEVTGQITGRPGVCIATLGPGAMNLCLGVANALLDRAPVIAVTAQVPASKESHFPHQRLALTELFGSITKRSIALDGVDTEGKVALAIATAVAPRPGPVHIMLPSDLAVQPSRPAESQAEVSPVSGVDMDQERSLEDARVALGSARFPLLVVGVGCHARDAPALRAFASASGIPFVVTPKAKGWLPEDAREFLGVVGGMAADAAVMDTVDRADVLLGVGFDPVECDKDWYVQRRVVNLDRASTSEGAYQPLEVLGEIGTNLTYLAARIKRSLRWPNDLLASRRQAVMARPSARLTRNGRVSPREVIDVLRDVMPLESILTSDVGSHKYYAAQYWQAHEPHTFLISNGLSAMGYGLPAAIAAKLAFPQKPVVAVVGDGGMLMMLHNLGFMRQYRVPVVVVVFVDETLSLIRIAQERRGYQPYGVDFVAPDFARIARTFGLAGTRATSIRAVRRAVADAIREQTATVIHVPIHMDEYYGFV